MIRTVLLFLLALAATALGAWCLLSGLGLTLRTDASDRGMGLMLLTTGIPFLVFGIALFVRLVRRARASTQARHPAGRST